MPEVNLTCFSLTCRNTFNGSRLLAEFSHHSPLDINGHPQQPLFLRKITYQ